MTPAADLRLAVLALLTFWFGLSYSRPNRKFHRREAALFVLLAILSAIQVGLEAQAATDPLTPISAVLPAVLASAYGLLSVLLLLGCIVAAVLLSRGAARKPLPAAKPAMATGLTLLSLTLLVLTGGAAFAEPAAAAGAASSGAIAMSPTLSVPRSTVGVKNPYAGDASSVERGKVIYQANCQVCHGISGDGRGPASANMRIKPASFRNPQHFQSPSMDGPHFWVIQHGDGEPDGMPAWQGKLTDQQTWDVLNYVKALSGQG